MSAAAVGAGTIATAAFTLPVLGFAAGPVFDRLTASWQAVGPLSRFTEADYVPTVITIDPALARRAGRSPTSAGTTWPSTGRSRIGMTA
jgi:hypothetical protein